MQTRATSLSLASTQFEEPVGHPESEEPVDIMESDVTEKETSVEPPTRPRRAAALRFIDQTKALALYEQDDELY